MAMTHTESQLQFVNHKTAMVFCGSWLENEMKASIPEDFELAMFRIPAVEGGAGNPRLIHGSGGEHFFVSADADFPMEAMEFARNMASPANARSMAETIGSLSPLRDAVEPKGLPSGLQSLIRVLDSSEGVYNDRIGELLLEFYNQDISRGLAALLRGEVTPEEFGAALNAGLQRSLASPDVFIPPYTPYDPAALGEPS
jgi:N-acetylglucosamine transport system substrate-binding protein